eukprot:gene56017-74788_t
MGAIADKIVFGGPLRIVVWSIWSAFRPQHRTQTCAPPQPNLTQVLARKYRPKNFDTLVGQEHVVRALTHALEQKRLHHAYLFTGTRGVGKTTLSRILAKALNCQGADGSGDITAHPCGVCDACTAIDA